MIQTQTGLAILNAVSALATRDAKTTRMKTMTAAEHAALSRDLALAIGYAPESVRIVHEHWMNKPVCQVLRSDGVHHGPHWVIFRHTNPTVCLPLIEWLAIRHRIFLWCSVDGIWSSSNGLWVPTLAEAVARACIAVKGPAK